MMLIFIMPCYFELLNFFRLQKWCDIILFVKLNTCDKLIWYLTKNGWEATDANIIKF